MKESIKIDGLIADKVRKEAKKRAQTIGGFLEQAAKQSITPQYIHFDNSNAFIEYLEKRGIKHKCLGHETVLIDIKDPVSIGMEWGIYKAQNDPHYKK